MSDVKGRAYESPVRDAQAARTRSAVIEAARDLFLEQGYAATTMEQIARRARVSKPTAFAAVGSKSQLFTVVRDIAMAGDDDPVPVAKRPSVDRAREAPTATGAVRALADHIGSVQSRYARIDAVLRGAAASGDADLLALWETAEAQRRQGAAVLVDIVAGKGRLGVSRAKAADLMSNLMAPDNYQRLVLALGWSERDYVRWLGDALTAQLLAPKPPTKAHTQDPPHG